MRKFFLLVCIAIISPKIYGDILYDTGAHQCNNACGGIGIYNKSSAGTVDFQFVAAEITLLSDAVLNSIKIWIYTSPNIGNTFTLAVYPDKSGVPDYTNELYSIGATIVDTGMGDTMGNQWQGVDNINWLLNPGKYWISLEIRDNQTLETYVPSGSEYPPPNPLENYAFYYSGNGGWFSDVHSSFGVIIEGSGSTPTTHNIPNSSNDSGGGSIQPLICLIMLIVIYGRYRSYRNISFRS